MLAPCDWIDHDEYGKYVVEVHGRTDELECAVLKIQGYRPYFYVAEEMEIPVFQKILLDAEIKATILPQEKYDVYGGFNFYEKTRVWKLEVDSLKDYRNLVKVAKSNFTRVYEGNLPPLLRFYHDHNIVPASPLKFTPTSKLKGEKKGWNVHHTNIKSDTTNDTPLKIAAYDIECMSKSGQFPIACKTWNYIVEKILNDIDDAPEEKTLTEIFQERLSIEGCTKKVNLLGFLKQERVLNAIDNRDTHVIEKGLAEAIGSEIGDPVIQIGITIRWSNSMFTNTRRRVFVLGSVVKHPEYVSCLTEGDVIESFMEFVQQEDPDIICGYNTYGFDDNFLFQRAKLCNVKLNLARTSVWGDPLERKTFELASGKYEVNFIKTPGRLTIDLLLNIRREYSLDSYKLDNVASTFLRDKVTDVINGTEIHTKNTRGLFAGNYVRFDVVGNTINPYRDGAKFMVKEVLPKKFIIELPDSETLFNDLSVEDRKSLEWSFTKDDVSPQELFALYEGTAEDRATIAKYCIQDCDLVLTLMAKLDTLVNARGMADVCFVPLQYLFLRGQGIKIFSRVAFEASQRNQIILTQESFDEDTSYEGAIVISPKIGMYLDTPVAVLDYNSLYPSSMIGENLSPDTFVCMKTYTTHGKLIEYEGLPIEKVRGIPNCHEVSYDLKDDNGKIIGKQVCVFKQPDEDNPLSVGLIPTALAIMLKKRKEARKMLEACTDDAQKTVYNGLQLAYKVVANSIYGQLGSRTSAIRKVCVAACTTAVGRRQLLFAKKTVEEDFGAEVVYGDTDSIFVKFPGKNLEETIKAGQESAALITSRCPHRAFVIGYEKTFFPFILFCRKRYVGMKYEEDPTKCKRASMGIVLKRRDNAPIVKDVFGGALDILLEHKDVVRSVKFVKEMLLKVIRGDLPLDKFAITKQLRDDYKDPTRIAHRVLADRMAVRDPGNKPNVGDRLKFVYIKSDKKLQGDKIEEISYVRERNIPLDTLFYITNQIQNPVAQLFALCIEKIEGYSEPSPSYRKKYQEYFENLGDQEEATLRVLADKEKQLDRLLFLGADYLRNPIRSTRTGPMDMFVTKKKL
jgi:DNA polymerase elongation subunit (family B)